MISNCGHDENSGYTGGVAGDQTGGEWAIRSWYKCPWLCVLRHPDASVRAEIARLARAAAQNDLIGYDQGERSTFWSKLAAAGYDPAAITEPCEADCSSGAMAIVKAVGYRLGLPALQAVNQGLSTHGMRAALQGAGFEVLTDDRYLTAASYLLEGDILLNDNQHTAINVTNGSKSAGEATAGSATPAPGAGGQTVQPDPEPEEIPVVNKGDLVTINPGATYYSGQAIPQWVLPRRWKVASVNGLRVVLGKSEDGAYNIQTPISARNITVVQPATPAVSAPVQDQPQTPATGSTASAAPAEPAHTYTKGEVVRFKGGPHYKSADASGSNGRPGPGPAKVTNIVAGSAHPYHVIHTDSSTGVYGWVNASDLEPLAAAAPATSSTATAGAATTTASTLVKVTAALLNVRSGPGMEYGIVTTVRAGEVLAITEQLNGWGLMKSNAGWVKLCYTAPQQPEAVG